MSLYLKNSCIKELLKTEGVQEKSIEPIYQYLKSLKVFSHLIKKQNSSKYESIFQELSKVIKMEKIVKNQLIINQGEIAENFFIVLNGHLQKLILRPYEYYMSEEEYILFLLQSRMNNQNEIIHQCKFFNSLIYPVPYDNFDDFVKDLSDKNTKGGLYIDSINAIKKAKELYCIISKEKKEELKLKNKNIKAIISPQEYIKKHKVSEAIIYNTYLINCFINNNLDDIKDGEIDKVKLMMKDRKKVIIPNYEIFSELEIGSVFGDSAFESQGDIYVYSVISIRDEGYLGFINKKEYFSLIHDSVDKRNKSIFSIILYFSLYRSINQAVFEKKYLHFFRDKIFDINSIIFNEGDECGEMYFTIEGEYELSVNKNIIEVNEMIITYKKVLQKLHKHHKLSSKYLNTDEEIKQNNSLILNQKYKNATANKLIMDKRYIKLNIIYERDIIGLGDVFLYNNVNHKKDDDNSNFNKPTIIYGKQISKKCLLTCKCLTNNCHTYCLNNIIFNNLYYNEGNYNVSSKALEVKKICSFIERLQAHKQYVFELVNKEQNKFAKNIYSLKFFTKNPKILRKDELIPGVYNNIVTETKVSIEQKEKSNKKSSNTLYNSIYNNDFLRNRSQKSRNKFNKLSFPSLFSNKKIVPANKFSLNIKLLKNANKTIKDKKDTIYNLYNKNSKDISQNNLAKLLIKDFLYEKYFYNYTFNSININDSNTQKNTDRGIYYKGINQRNNKYYINSNNYNNLKTEDNREKDAYKSYSCDKVKKFINIGKIKINKNILDNNNVLYKNIDFDRPILTNRISDSSIEGNVFEKKSKNEKINTLTNNETKKIRLKKIGSNNIYDPLAFDRFNNFFNINFRNQYFISSLSN